MAQVTYPNATHTRFAHSLGTLGIMDRILAAARATSYYLGKRQQENLRMAALLHDIGHYPYSHVMERIDTVTLTEEEVQGGARAEGAKKAFDATRLGYPPHEDLGTEVVIHQDDLTKAIGGRARAKQVADLEDVPSVVEGQ